MVLEHLMQDTFVRVCGGGLWLTESGELIADSEDRYVWLMDNDVSSLSQIVVLMENLPGVLHDALIGTGHVESYALIRRKDAVVKACSQNFSLRPEQGQFLLDVFKNTTALRERGVTFKSKFYECIRADKNSIYAKNVDGSGLIVVRTIAFVIIGQYSSKMSPAVCVEAVERLSDYFRDKGK